MIILALFACVGSGISAADKLDDSEEYTGGPDDADADGYLASEDDCDDNDDAVHPGAVEICDGKDNDCNGDIDDDEPVDAEVWYVDNDGDGYGSDDYERACEAPGSGYATEGGDCDDDNSAVNPGATEICDELWTDEDCNDVADDYDPDVDSSTQMLLNEDSDGDGYGNPEVEDLRCHLGNGWVDEDTDCDDTSAALTPENECDLGWYGTYTGDFVYNGVADILSDSCLATGVSITIDPSKKPQISGSFTCTFAGTLASLGPQTVTVEGTVNSDDTVEGNFFMGDVYVDPWTGTLAEPGVMKGSYTGLTTLMGFDISYDGTLSFAR